MAVQTFITRILEAKQAVSVDHLDGHRYAVSVDGVQHEVDARYLAGNSWSLIIDGESHDLEIDHREGNEIESTYDVFVGEDLVRIRLQDERLARIGVSSARLQAHGPQTLRAPMPGRVVKILTAIGVEVAAGTPILIIEAMKMENEVRAPGKGRVCAIMVREGQAVEGGAALLSIE